MNNVELAEGISNYCEKQTLLPSMMASSGRHARYTAVIDDAPFERLARIADV